MELIRGGQKAPIATDWVTAVDISGTGTSVISSAAMDLILSGLPSLSEPPTIEMRFTAIRSGGTGAVNVWGYIENSQGDLTVAQGAVATGYYTGAVQAATSLITKIYLVKTNTLVSMYNADAIRVKVQAKGSVADTECSVTEIKTRLIYTPL